MDIALLFSTVKSGNSSIAISDAEYTDAPASLTITYLQSKPFSLMTSAMKLSVSLPAVPLPMAIIDTLYFLINLAIVILDSITNLGSTFESLDFSFG